MSHRSYALDALRGVAAFGVAIPHIALYLRPGSFLLEAAAVIGVEIFFVLSGYVLAPQILRCMWQPSDLPIFLVRRWIRTIPPYLVALVVISLAYSKLGTGDFVRYATYSQNIFSQTNSEDYFSIAWSLSVEEWFYVVFPLALIMVGLIWRPALKRPLVVATGFILVFVAARLVFTADLVWGYDVRRVVVFRLDSIAYGFVLHLLLKRPPRFIWAFLVWVCLGAAGLCCLWFLQETKWPIWEVAFPLLAAAFGISCVCIALSLDGRFERHAPLRFVSKWAASISYSVYLFHGAAWLFVSQAMPVGMWRGPTVVAVTLSSLTVFCILFFVCFERPLLRSRPGYRPARTNYPVKSESTPLSDTPVATDEI